MNIKGTLIRMARNLLLGQPKKIVVQPQIVTLAPNELLKGRVALITGGTSGIGFEMARTFVDSGASVIITGRKREKVDAACKKIDALAANKGKVRGIDWDNTKVDTFKARFGELLALSPDGKIDILVNNAGVLVGMNLQEEPEQFDLMLNTNLRGSYYLSILFGRYFKEQHIPGNILNVASSSSLRPAVSAYTLSKWGIRGLTMGLAKAFAPYGITVNGVAPGPTATPMLLPDASDIRHPKVPIGRYVMPQEIANIAMLLVSDAGRAVVGDIVYATGGAGTVTYDDINYTF